MYPRQALTGATSTLVTGIVLMPILAFGDSTPLMETPLTGMEGMKANIVRFEVGPDWITERHIHTGDVFVYVIEGSVRVDVEGQEPQTISAGEAFHEPPNVPMVGRVVSEEGAEFVVFQVSPEGKAMREPSSE